MFRKMLFVIAILAGTMLNSAAQTGEIRGKIIEKETGEPMTGVNIVMTSPGDSSK